MYWLFQEWILYHTLLDEPIALNVLELSILLIGSLAEGLTIGYVIEHAMGRAMKPLERPALVMLLVFALTAVASAQEPVKDETQSRRGKQTMPKDLSSEVAGWVLGRV